MITTTTDGSVTVVRLDRPERRNALTPEGLDALYATLEGASTPVVALEGAGEAFCAGADVDALAGLADREAARQFARHGQRVANAIADGEHVVVACLDGAARGGGVELALACDVRIATDAATIAETGVTLGLFGAWGGTSRLPAIVGRGAAMDLALSGRVIDAREARRMGLVSRIVDDPRQVAHEIAANDPDTLRVIRDRLRDDADRETADRREADDFATLWASFDP